MLRVRGSNTRYVCTYVPTYPARPSEVHRATIPPPRSLVARPLSRAGALDIDFRFQFNAVTDILGTIFPIPISCYRTFRRRVGAPTRRLAAPGTPVIRESRRDAAARHRGVWRRDQRRGEKLPAHEYSPTINISTFLFVCSATVQDRDRRREREHARLEGRAVRGG